MKEKITEIPCHQDYRNAVNRGTKSGSGRIVQDNFELLTEIWGGSPATTSLPFGVPLNPAREGDPTMFELCL